jgi:hypothetical protein
MHARGPDFIFASSPTKKQLCGSFAVDVPSWKSAMSAASKDIGAEGAWIDLMWTGLWMNNKATFEQWPGLLCVVPTCAILLQFCAERLWRSK